MTSAPGCSFQSRIVKSKSGNRPHLVISDKGLFSCDNGCGHWKALGICSHSVVVAELNNSLPSFVVAFQKKKKLPNLTALVLSSVPKGRGRKGAKPPRKWSNQQPTEERVQLAVTHSSTSGGTSGHINTNQSPAVLCSSPLSASVVQQNVCVGGNISQVVSPLERTPAPPHIHGTCGPPPLISFPRGDANQQIMTPPPVPPSPFTLQLVHGNISVCTGCRGQFIKGAASPYNLCVKHMEWRQFTPYVGGTLQQKYGNAYYHCHLPCIHLRWPSFTTSDLQIPEDLHLDSAQNCTFSNTLECHCEFKPHVVLF